ncbi:hypothetical protein NFI96_031163 [Prochilodus magdalenae]|nr:hypothetical protein NFI96_031163 [Prochilodus magdalenae]
MAGNIYDVIRTEELNRGERVEMVVDIYESTDGVRGQETTTEMEDTSPKTTQQTQHPGSRCCGLAAVCLGLLCVLLLAAITVQWFKKGQLQTSNTNLAKQRDQLQKDRGEFERKFSEVETLITQQEWIYFSSSIYYISTEKKSWRESRQHCKGKGADLVIINSKEEQVFINRLRGGQTAWIGLKYSYTEGGWRWRWVDDSAVDTRFWSHGEPYDYECVVTGYGSDPLQNWYNYDCSVQQYWICEKRVIS